MSTATHSPSPPQPHPDASPPSPGQAVRVRTRTYLVESVERSPGTGTLDRMARLDDDAQGQPLEVVWELELAPDILDREAWQSIGRRGFDNAPHFSAFIHTLRWTCATSTDPKLFQAPFRAAIADTDLADYRIEVYHGPTPPDKREAIKRAFNDHPQTHPLRILVATDAAREGVSLQAPTILPGRLVPHRTRRSRLPLAFDWLTSPRT